MTDIDWEGRALTAEAVALAFRRRAIDAEAKVARVAALERKWSEDGITCECGHTLDTHNGLGCYERLSYEPLVTCPCVLTDDRHDTGLALDDLRAALNLSDAPVSDAHDTEAPGQGEGAHEPGGGL